LRHTRVEPASYGTFKAHMNLGFKWSAIPSHGTEELDETDADEHAVPEPRHAAW